MFLRSSFTASRVKLYGFVRLGLSVVKARVSVFSAKVWGSQG